jgi:hypothetical protein
MLKILERKLPYYLKGFYLPYLIIINSEINDFEKSLAIFHEKIHHRQFLVDKLFFFKYIISKRKKFEYEIEAYAEELKYLLNIEYKNQFIKSKYYKIINDYIIIKLNKYRYKDGLDVYSIFTQKIESLLK